ncbi:MAG: hypothetical protein VB092_07830 [Oscillospiraceae bacterium]|nr:hypothetical protein [Oscillospiraceae bacterium]
MDAPIVCPPTGIPLEAQERALSAEADKRGMTFRVFGRTAVVCTDEAQWLICETDCGLELYHENASCRNGANKYDYHPQCGVTCTGPLGILLYIYNHDVAHIKRYSETHGF